MRTEGLISATPPARDVSLSNLSPAEGYRLWSRIFDDSPTPMQVLEQRFLQAVLPPCNGIDVLDLGCGTGRWLKRLLASGASSLTGVDSSPEMLARAASSAMGIRAVLASCEALPLRPLSADVILCSFALSHVEELGRFVQEVARVARPGARVFVTDLHPGTVSLLGWRRGFRLDGMHVDIEMKCRPLEEIASAFIKCGFQLSIRLEPRFGEPERATFEKAGKGQAFENLCSHPAIYILQFTKRAAVRRNSRVPASVAHVQRISGARAALHPGEAARAELRIHSGCIESIVSADSVSKNAATVSQAAVDLSGFLLLPGLVNAHDHLEFALFPRLGSGNYRNYVEWSKDIYRPGDSPVREQLAVPKTARLLWGGIRNLLCGVTTVCHHNPYAATVFTRDFPVRVVRDFGWAHSLALGKEVATEFKRTPKDNPFIIHLCEGVDEQSADEIFELEQKGALDCRTVMVHGLGLDARGLRLVQSSRAALIWCPSSNVFLFGRTHRRESLAGFAQVALGSDSPLTAQGDLLDEVHFAHSGIGIACDEVYEQVTSRAAGVLRLTRGEGCLRAGALADFFAVRDRGLTPAETLATISWRDVEVVVVDGRVQLASQRLYEQFPSQLKRGLQFLRVEDEIRWVRAPIPHLLRETSKALGPEIRLGGRRVSNERAS